MKSRAIFDAANELGRTSMKYDTDPNEARADWGEAGIIMADPDFGSNETVISVKDAVANICHAIERMGLDPSELLHAGHSSYESDIADEVGGFGAGPRVQRDTERYPDPDNGLPAWTVTD